MRFGGDQFEDRPASHAAAHAEGEWCPCQQDDPPGWHFTGWDVALGFGLIAVIWIVAVLT